MNKPLIGITGSLLKIESGAFFGLQRSFIGHDYVLAILEAGGVPLILPVIEDNEAILRYSQLLDGLILSGGVDVHTQLYHQEPQKNLGPVIIERDLFEIKLFKEFYRLKKPVFGICRGIQLMNVAFGGSLHQDIASTIPEALQHNQYASPHTPTHTVDLIGESFLRSTFQSSSILTNSYHHQSIATLAPGFRITAISKDGVVEGIESEEDFFCLGVQWHPELMISTSPQMRELFCRFVKEC